MDLFAYANEVAPTLLIAEAVAAPAPRIAPILAAVDVLTEAIGQSDFSRHVLDNIMTEAFGGTDASGAWTVQQAYNALEGALAKRLLAAEGQPQYDDIMTLLSRLPAQNRRTSDKDELQQFSTPPTIGLVAARLAQISPHDTVLEPSVGTGLLGLFAARAGATMVINEIDSERLRIARHVLQPTHAHGFDGRFISIYGKRLGAPPSLVLMNPPFSSDGGAGHSSEIGLAHVYQAASVLRPGGRLVTILAEFQHPQLRPDLWTKVQELCSLRAAYMVAPGEYHKLGTDYGVCVVMLDKRLGLETVESNAAPTSVQDLLKALPVIGRQDVGSIRFVDTSRAAIDIRKREIRTYKADFPEVEALVYRSAAPADRNDEGIFVQYAPYLDIEGAQPHPEALVESAALSCVRPPVPLETVRLPKGVKDRLSVAQLESVIYAAHAHAQEIQLLDESDEGAGVYAATRGIMFGHGTGFGKGRTMAGIIASNFAEGRTKAMWFSENQTLCEDAQRDIVDVFGSEHSYALFNVSDFPANVDIERDHGILYSTYATLRSEGRQDTRSRLEQIATWAGENFDGVIIFDESHNLANATEGEGTRGKTKASKQAIAAVQLQRRFPKARIVYTSATSASKIDAFLYAPRLGLFGPDTAFPTQAQFVQQLGSGGTAAMELLCRDAKALGVYLATNLSMAGVTYERLEHVMTPEQIEQYDAIAEAWLIIDREAKRILDLTDAGGLAKGAALSKLESTRLRCLQSVLVTAKLPTVLEHSSQALENGKAPVFQLTNTYEAAQERALARLTEDEGADLEDLDLSPKEQIFAYLDQAFPVTQYVQRNINGKLISEPMVDTDGSQVANPEAIEARENLKAKIASLIIPMSPLDIIIDHFGPETIAEVTGRKRRVISKEEDGERKRVIEPRNEHTNSAETEAFMQGKKRALIFSEGAGGTGRSYHASLKCQNQDQRWQYLAQTGWRSDKAVQGFPGRTHRTFQACAPHGILCSTDAPGEKRFLSTIARRLEELGACTRGQRDAAGTGVFSASDNLETEYAFTAITALLHRIAAGKCDEIPYDEWMEYTNFPLTDERDGKEKQITLSVPRFLNKMLASPLWFQRKLMDLFLSQLDATVEAAKSAGTFDTGIETLDALSINIAKRQAIYEDPNSGAKTELVTLEAEYKTKTTSFGTALSRVREQRERYTSFQSGFVKSDTGNIYAAYPIGNTWVDNRGAARPYWKLVSPTRMETLQERPGYGYVHVTDDDAAELWAAEFEAIGETVKVPVYIVSGTLLPVYDRLPNDQGKVMRVTMDNGERIIGRVIKEAELQMFLQRFNIDAQPEVSEIITRLHNRATVRLTNSYVLRKVRFMDDARIECIVPRHLALTAASTLRSFGLLHERVNYEHRFFLPVGTEEEVLSKLLERNKVAQVAAAA